MDSKAMAIEITEDLIRYDDGTIQRPPIGYKFDVDIIKKIMEAVEYNSYEKGGET